MSYRKRILRVLMGLNLEKGPEAYMYLDPPDIIGRPGDEKYKITLEQLLHEELVLGVEAENRPVFRVNPRKIDQVRTQIRHWFLDVRIHALIGSLVAIAAVVWAIIQFFLT